MKHFNNTTQAIPPPDAQQMGIEHIYTPQAGAKLPLMQALITALILGATITILLWLIGCYFLTSVKWGAAVMVLSLSAYWLYSQLRWFSLTQVENWIGRDIDGDGVIGSRQTLRVEVSRDEDGTHSTSIIEDWCDFVTAENLLELAEGLIAGKPFSERTWTGKNGLFSQNEFKELREMMLRRGLIAHKSTKSGNVGYELTDAGWAVMQGVVDGGFEDD